MTSAPGNRAPRDSSLVLLQRVAELRDRVQRWRAAGERVALVPTMGNLHAGHLKLVEVARQHAARVVVTVFVNPLQFAPDEDFRSYPRTLEADRQKLQGAGADALFAPAVAEMYPRDQDSVTRVIVPVLGEVLEGQFRPGHFGGVATVVLKLFNLAQPDIAIFGKKDYQQLLVIRRMTADLSLPIEIAGVETVREADGLALSSRNQYLTREERKQAPLLHATLTKLAASLRSGQRDFAELEADALRELSACMRPDYVAVRDAATLTVPAAGTRLFVVLAAAWLGKARLIDNVEIAAPA